MVLKNLTYVPFVMAWLICAGSYQAGAQDNVWSQPLRAPLFLNPSEAGSTADFRASVRYKKAWSTLAAPYRTTAAAFDMRLTGKSRRNALTPGSLGVGITLLNDKAGNPELVSNLATLMVAYNLFINNTSRLGVGLAIGYDQRSTNPAGGKWASQYNGYFYDPTIVSGESFGGDSEAHLDVGFGVRHEYLRPPARNGKSIPFRIDAGLSGKHLGRVALDDSQFITEDMPAQLAGYVRSELPIAESTAIVPVAVGNYAGVATDIMVGMGVKQLLVYGESFIRDIKQSAAELGVYYRVDKAIIIHGQIDWGAYGFGLAYDMDISDLQEYSSRKAGFELFFSWQMNDEK